MRIGTYNETALHAQLKAWFASGPGDRTEVPLDGRRIDVVQGDLLVEIQTGNFGSIRSKLEDLLERHPVRLVHPVSAERWIVRQGPDGQTLGRRRSTRRGRLEDAFAELVRLPRLFLRPSFSFEVLLVRDEEERVRAGRAWRNRGWVVHGRRLLGVLERRLFQRADLLGLLPPGLTDPFTTADLALGLGVQRCAAQQLAYVLHAASTRPSSRARVARRDPRPRPSTSAPRCRRTQPARHDLLRSEVELDEVPAVAERSRSTVQRARPLDTDRGRDTPRPTAASPPHARFEPLPPEIRAQPSPRPGRGPDPESCPSQLPARRDRTP